VNLAHVVTAVEFVVAEIAELPDEKALPRHDEIEPAPPAAPLERPVSQTAA